MRNIKPFGMHEEEEESWLSEDFSFTNYVKDNLPFHVRHTLSEDNVKHVVHNLKLLADAYSGKEADDDFIKSLLEENYMEALLNADDVNKVTLYVYLMFTINKVPMELRDQFKEE